MKRRLFDILAGVSLALCLATAGLWVGGECWPGPVDFGSRFAGISADVGGMWVRWTVRTSGAPTPDRYVEFVGFRYEHADPHRHPQAAVWPRHHTTVIVPFWFLCYLAAILPALWLWRYRRDRRLRNDGMPHCAKCDYNLTGNVSGICPECGVPVPVDLIRQSSG